MRRHPTKSKHHKPCCPRCRHPGYTVGKALDERPAFTCTKCGNYWTAGRDGGEYLKPLKETP